MLLIDCEPTDIWKLLLPKKNVLFPSDQPKDELIFYYRDYLYFAHEDGSVVRMSKPEKLENMTPDDLWERLFYEKDTFDYDDHGLFSIGSVLIDMGYLVQINTSRAKNYRVELVNLMASDQIRSLEYHKASFQYVLSQAFIECHRINRSSDGVDEYEVLQITEYEQPIERFHY